MSVRRVKWKDSETGKMKLFWIVDFRFQYPDGRRERVRKISSVQTRRGAEEYEKQLRESLLTGRSETETPTFEDFSKEFLKSYAAVNNKPSEINSKKMILRIHLIPKLGKYKLNEITDHMIEKFKADQLKTDLSPSTINNQLATLRKILGTAVEWKFLGRCPSVKKLRAPKPQFDFLTFEEAEKLENAAVSEPEWHSLIVVALNTGLRMGELLALSWKDVNLETARLVVRNSDWRGHTGTTKSGKNRTIPLNTKAVKAFTDQMHQRGLLVWCDKTGKAFHYYNLNGVLERIRKRANLRHFGWHVLRHTFASHLTMRGIQLKATQELLGHASMEMTMRYAHLSPNIKQEAVNALVA